MTKEVIIQVGITVANWTRTTKRGAAELLSHHATDAEKFDNCAYRVINPHAVPGWIAKLSRSNGVYFEQNSSAAIDAQIAKKTEELQALQQRRSTATPVNVTEPEVASLLNPPTSDPVPPFVAPVGQSTFEALVVSHGLTNDWINWMSQIITNNRGDDKLTNEKLNTGLRQGNMKPLNASELKVVKSQLTS